MTETNINQIKSVITTVNTDLEIYPLKSCFTKTPKFSDFRLSPLILNEFDAIIKNEKQHYSCQKCDTCFINTFIYNYCHWPSKLPGIINQNRSNETVKLQANRCFDEFPNKKSHYKANRVSSYSLTDATRGKKWLLIRTHNKILPPMTHIFKKVRFKPLVKLDIYEYEKFEWDDDDLLSISTTSFLNFSPDNDSGQNIADIERSQTTETEITADAQKLFIPLIGSKLASAELSDNEGDENPNSFLFLNHSLSPLSYWTRNKKKKKVDIKIHSKKKSIQITQIADCSKFSSEFCIDNSQLAQFKFSSLEANSTRSLSTSLVFETISIEKIKLNTKLYQATIRHFYTNYIEEKISNNFDSLRKTVVDYRGLKKQVTISQLERKISQSCIYWKQKKLFCCFGINIPLSYLKSVTIQLY